MSQTDTFTFFTFLQSNGYTQLFADDDDNVDETKRYCIPEITNCQYKKCTTNESVSSPELPFSTRMSPRKHSLSQSPGQSAFGTFASHVLSVPYLN